MVPHDPIASREAIELALRRVGDVEVSTRWTDAELYGRTPADPMPADPDWAGATIFTDTQTVHIQATRAALYEQVCSLGGDRGWLVGNWLWAVRGWIARMVGGVGLRRGRRHPTELRVGDVVDFWRVEALEPQRLLRLRAEMLLPGDAWLEWTITPEPEHAGTVFVQRACSGRAACSAAGIGTRSPRSIGSSSGPSSAVSNDRPCSRHRSWKRRIASPDLPKGI